MTEKKIKPGKPVELEADALEKASAGFSWGASNSELSGSVVSPRDPASGLPTGKRG